MKTLTDNTCLHEYSHNFTNDASPIKSIDCSSVLANDDLNTNIESLQQNNQVTNNNNDVPPIVPDDNEETNQSPTDDEDEIDSTPKGPFTTTMYAVGGTAGWNLATSGVMSFNFESNHWSYGIPLLHPRCDHEVAVLNHRMYAVGGFDGTKSTWKSGEVFNPSTNKWTLISRMRDAAVLD